METMFHFELPLKEGIVVKRANRFIMDVELEGQVVECFTLTFGG